jgi:CBS domain
MAEDPVSVDADTPIEGVADLMRDTGVRHLPVVAGDDVVGMIPQGPACRPPARRAGGSSTTGPAWPALAVIVIDWTKGSIPGPRCGRILGWNRPSFTRGGGTCPLWIVSTLGDG